MINNLCYHCKQRIAISVLVAGSCTTEWICNFNKTGIACISKCPLLYDITGVHIKDFKKLMEY